MAAAGASQHTLAVAFPKKGGCLICLVTSGVGSDNVGWKAGYKEETNQIPYRGEMSHNRL